MTDKEKIRKKIERLYVYWDGVMQSSAATEAVARKNMCKELLSFIDSLQEEPVSEDLEKGGKEWLRPQLDKSYAKYGETKMMELTHFDGYAMLEAIEFGANWHKHHMEVNRIKHCNSISKEQAELEQKFLDEHLDKYNRMPTFLDAIEYGMRFQKEQMMKNAVECEYFDGSLFRNDLREKYRDCDKVKVIVIKED